MRMFYNYDTRPFRGKMRYMSMSDVIIINRGGEKNAYYVDTIGFKEADEFLKNEKQKEMSKHNGKKQRDDNEI